MSTGSRGLLIPELHPGNLFFYTVLSLFVDVETLYFHPFCVGSRRVRQVGGRDAFSCAEGWAFRVRAVYAWEALAARIPRSDWQAVYRGLDLDFSSKAKQDLWRAFEDFLLLKAIQQKRKNPRLHVVASARAAYLLRFDASGDTLAGVSLAQWVGRVHRLLDRVWQGTLYIAELARVTGWLAAAVLGRLSPARSTLNPCSILYLCDSPDQLDTSPHRKSFTWLIDDARVAGKDVLAVLPDGADERLRRVLDQLPALTLQAGRLRDLYRRVPGGVLISLLIQTVGRLFPASAAPCLPVRSSMLKQYVLGAVEFDPIVRCVRPNVSVESCSSLGIEKPALVYLNRLGISTVMCQMSGMLFFYRRPGGVPVREFYCGHVLASRILCWHDEARDLMLAHPQENCEVSVVGPVMPGRTEVMFEDRSGFRLRLLPPGRPAALADKKWLSVFDVLPYSNPPFRKPGFRAYEEPFTEEYWVTFVEDVVRLLSDDPELVIVYKPKRVHILGKRVPLAAKFPTKSDEYIRLMDIIRSHERTIIVDESENPWMAIAVADVCLSPPAGSPISAAWHFGVPGIYHDPLGTLGPKDYYQELEWCVTHDYAGLRSRVREFLGAGAGSDGGAVWPDALQHFVGRVRGSDAAADVRELLTVRRGDANAADVIEPMISGRC